MFSRSLQLRRASASPTGRATGRPGRPPCSRESRITRRPWSSATRMHVPGATVTFRWAGARPDAPDAHGRPRRLRRPVPASTAAPGRRSGTTPRSTSLVAAGPGPRPLVRVPGPGALTSAVTSRRGRARSASGCRSGRDRTGGRAAGTPPPVRRRQPDQRPDPRLRRADEAPGAGRVARPRTSPPRTSPRTTCSTRRGSSGCAGSASSRARAGCSRRRSTRASPTAWA